MSRFEYALSSAVLRVCLGLFSMLPIQRDKVVFASARSARLEGNLRYIHEEMERVWSGRRYVFLLRTYSYTLWGKLGYMLSLIGGSYHLATAPLCLVDNAYLPVHVRPHRAGTTVIQVWHAAGALKKFGVDALPATDSVERRFLHRYYDYVIVGSEEAIDPYASALRTDPSHVIALGSPRTDFFDDAQKMDAARARFLSRYPELRGKTIVLYAPTFRGHGRSKRSGADLDAQELRRLLPGSHALIYKVHPVLQTADMDEAGFDVVIGSDFDINGLFTATDILITDYSASIFEYALTRKPLILFAPDLDEYRMDPGFYLEYPDSLVGELASSAEEIAAIIEADRCDLAEYDRFIGMYMSQADGHASERFVEFASKLV